VIGHPTLSEIKRHLDAGVPVILALYLTTSFFVPRDGHIAPPSDEDELHDGHAVLIVGYEDGEEAGIGSLIVRNSWGATWGKDGYAFLPYAYVERYGAQAAYVQELI
jgi:C1A family cysteine protease